MSRAREGGITTTVTTAAMATGSRTSRRALLLYALSGAFLLVLVLVVKDLNDKLNVMTHSNMGYQRMTDKQTERIKKLQARVWNTE